MADIEKYYISGQVTDPSHSDQVGGLRVDALAKGPVITHPFGSARTDAQGNFEISFTKRYLVQCFPNNAVNKGGQAPYEAAAEFLGDWLAEKLSR